MRFRSIVSTLAVLSFAAVFSGGCVSTAQSESQGSAMYAAPASQGGQAVSPQQNEGDMSLTVAIDGAGTFAPIQNATCALTQGSLSESATSTGQVASDGSYVSAFSTESATGVGSTQLCGTLKNVKLTSITSMTVQATVPTNTVNCQGYCKATASVQCQGSVDASCASTAAATCSTRCEASTKITGHGSLQSSDMAAANSQLTDSNGNVDAHVDLIFDALQ
jgi:hypothetical protein